MWGEQIIHTIQKCGDDNEDTIVDGEGSTVLQATAVGSPGGTVSG